MSLRSFLRNWAIGSTAIIAVSVTVQSTAGAGPTPGARQDVGPVPGSQGTDTALPLTDSAVTVQGRGKFAGLEITVNQTKNLTNQAVSITWEGGTPTNFAQSRFWGDYLQIMQCWGDDDGTVPGNPGPPPEQCVQGATAGAYTAPDLPLNRGAAQRLLAVDGWATFDPNVGHVEGNALWMPFRAVDGAVVNVQENAAYNPRNPTGDYWLNPFFNIVTTNEVAAAATQPDGTGAEPFQVLTGVESSGLGCGRRVQLLEDGTTKTPQCWIVVVPRGTPTEENAGTGWEERAEQYGVQTSPLAPNSWQHRVAIPIDFNSAESACSLANGERRIVGNEMVLTAVASWQPALCGGGSLPPYAYSPVADSIARLQLSNPQAGSPGMAVVSDPLPPSTLDPANPVLYGPVSVSGVTIGFNLERQPHFSAPDAEQRLAGIRVAELNLTPRLVAKLLTQSYQSQFSFSGAMPDLTAPAYEWLAVNPPQLSTDTDFLRFNPEFALLSVGHARTFGGLQLPAGNSDAARRLWEWILADPEASAWLAGQPDEWGMRVNPLFHFIATAAPAPNSFPKADPYCYQPPPIPGTSIQPPSVCAIEMLPYASGLRDAAIRVRMAYDGARIAANALAIDAQSYWQRVNPQRIGTKAMLSVTDTASAARYGVQTARLSRAGDDGDEREFVAPTVRAMNAAVAAMDPGQEAQVLQTSPGSVPAGAYPLTIVNYAAIAPLALDDQARHDYAAFLDYAAIAGQQPGYEPGQLPPGYSPLPPDLVLQSVLVAELVRDLEPAPTTTTTTTTAATTTTATTTTEATTVPTSAPTSEPSSTTTTSTTSTSTPEAPPAGPADPPELPSASGPSVGSGGNVPPVAVPRASPPPNATTTTTPAGSVPNSASPASAPSTDPAPAVDESTAVGDEPPPAAEVPPVLTPLMQLGRSRFAVPGLGVVGLGSALGALEITKRPRRVTGHVETEDS